MRLTPPTSPSLSLLFLTATIALSSTAHAQGDNGFLRGKGHGDLVITFGQETFSETVPNPGKVEVDRNFTSLYTAYGVTNDLDLGLNASYLDIVSDGEFPSQREFQDISLFAKARFFQKRGNAGTYNLIAKPGIKIPLSNYKDDLPTAVGDGQVDVQARIVGQYHGDDGLFAALETGYDFRNGAPSDEVFFSLSLGGNVTESLFASAFFTTVESLGTGDIGSSPFLQLGEDYSRYGANAFYRVNPEFGVSASAWQTADLLGLSLGLVWSF